MAQSSGKSTSDSVSLALKASKMTLPSIRIDYNKAVKVSVSWNVDFAKIRAVFMTYVCSESSDRVVLSDYDENTITLRGSSGQYIDASLIILHE